MVNGLVFETIRFSFKNNFFETSLFLVKFKKNKIEDFSFIISNIKEVRLELAVFMRSHHFLKFQSISQKNSKILIREAGGASKTIANIKIFLNRDGIKLILFNGAPEPPENRLNNVWIKSNIETSTYVLIKLNRPLMDCP